MNDVLPAPKMQRIRGEARGALVREASDTVLRDLRQAGSAKAMLPRTDDAPEVVFLNTAGGVTSGDALDDALHLGAGGRRRRRRRRNAGTARRTARGG